MLSNWCIANQVMKIMNYRRSKASRDPGRSVKRRSIFLVARSLYYKCISCINPEGLNIFEIVKLQVDR